MAANDNDSKFGFGKFQGATEAKLSLLFNEVNLLREEMRSNHGALSRRLDHLEQKVDALRAWKYSVAGGIAVIMFMAGLVFYTVNQQLNHRRPPAPAVAAEPPGATR